MSAMFSPSATMTRRPRARRAATLLAAIAILLAGCADASPSAEPTDARTSATPTAASSPAEGAASESTERTAGGTPATGSGSAGESGGRAEPEPPAAQTQRVIVLGSGVLPNGKRVDIEPGETLRLEIESDRAGELHVHATPEQVVEFPEGRSTRDLVIERPGIVDVEEHDTGLVVMRVYVS